MEVTLFYSIYLPALAVSAGGLAAAIPQYYFPDQKKWADEEGKRCQRSISWKLLSGLGLWRLTR